MTTVAFLPTLGLMEILILGVGLLSLAVPIWGIIDAAQRPDRQWQGIDNSKGTWLLLMGLGTLLCGPVGVVAAIYYLAVLRPRLDAVGETPI